MRDFVQCYVDALYLKATLRLPPRPVALAAEPVAEERLQAAPPRDAARAGIASALRCLFGPLRRHLEMHAAALAGRRSLRRTGGSRRNRPASASMVSSGAAAMTMWPTAGARDSWRR